MSAALAPQLPMAPGDLDALIQCYADVNAAMDFLSRLIIDLINNNPAVAEAIIQAIEKSGSALPLLGTTNGTPSVPPQVGQYVQLSATLDYTATTAHALLNLGILPPGDWDCWLWATVTSVITGAIILLNPLPAGFAANPATSIWSGVAPPNAPIFSMTVEALTTLDQPIVADTQVAATSGQSGTMTVYFAARRRR